MKLIDLSPKWQSFEDHHRVALSFICPCCIGTERETHLMVAFHHHGHEIEDDAFIRAHGPGGQTNHIWTIEGDEDFNTLTLTPSIDASKSGHWHGFITNGEVR
jgi:hypothetical protein